MENDTHGESRPPLLRRWVLLSCKSQTVKDSLCLAIFAITLQILSGQYVFMAILIALELGLLIVMDYRDWVNQQVSPRTLYTCPLLLGAPRFLVEAPRGT